MSQQDEVTPEFLEALDRASGLHDRGQEEEASKVMLVAMQALLADPMTKAVGEQIIRSLAELAQIQKYERRNHGGRR
jgi:hypothetical protein